MNLLPRWFRKSPPAVSWIEPGDLAYRLDHDAGILVLDVRGPEEFLGPLGHITQATNTPLPELSAHLSGLSQETRAIVVVCKTDKRSSIAAHQLRAAGLSNISVLRGGMERWRALGLHAS